MSPQGPQTPIFHSRLSDNDATYKHSAHQPVSQSVRRSVSRPVRQGIGQQILQSVSQSVSH
eukprot:11169045-Lingulodinium_polyedra.AAC.1